MIKMILTEARGNAVRGIAPAAFLRGVDGTC